MIMIDNEKRGRMKLFSLCVQEEINKLALHTFQSQIAGYKVTDVMQYVKGIV